MRVPIYHRALATIPFTIFMFGSALGLFPLMYWIDKKKKYMIKYAPLVKQSALFLQNESSDAVTQALGQPIEFQIFDFEEDTSTDGQLVKLAFPVHGKLGDALVCCWAAYDESINKNTAAVNMYKYGSIADPWAALLMRKPRLLRFDNSLWQINRIEVWPEGESKDTQVVFVRQT